MSNGTRFGALCSSVALTLLMALPEPAWASTQALASQTDKIFEAWNQPDEPGCACGVMKRGELIYAKGFGSADLEHAAPLTADSVFYIASTSKQFTAASIGLLVVDGKIALKDDIRKFVPEMPNYGATITVEQLLYHTSGLRDYLELAALIGWNGYDQLNNHKAVQLLARQRGLNFTPGSQYSYSNSNYVLLAEIVKRVSGMPLSKFAKERIFVPLGMTATRFGDDVGEVVPNRVISYSKRPDGRDHQFVKTIEAVGDGNLLTTVRDLARWQENFYTGKVGGPALLKLLSTRGALNDGKSIDYGFGLSFGHYRNVAFEGHAGGFLGFRTELLRFPEQQISVAVLCNFAAANASGLARQVADLYLTGLAPVEKPGEESSKPTKTEPFAPKPESLAAFTGAYRSDELDTTFHFVVEGDRLVVRAPGDHSIPLEPVAQDVFRVHGTEVRFRRDASGKVDGFSYSSSRVASLMFDRQSD